MDTVTAWRTSRTCDGGACAEVGQDGPGIAIRDTEDRCGPVLTFRADDWKWFTSGLKREAP